MSSFLPKSFGGGTQRSSDGGPQRRFSKAVTRINSPGQRFTATHGISAKVRNILTLQVDKCRKPLVCADFHPHQHAYCTHFCSVRRTHPHPSFKGSHVHLHIFSKKIYACGPKNWDAGSCAAHYKNVCELRAGAPQK